MDVKFRKEENTVVVEIAGRLDTTNYESFSSQLTDIIAKGGDYFLCDMEKLDYISSSGLRVFLATLKQLRAKGGDLALYGMNDKINDVFNMSGFSSLFKIYVSWEDAIK